jgi:hypothetical protein
LAPFCAGLAALIRSGVVQLMATIFAGSHVKRVSFAEILERGSLDEIFASFPFVATEYR